MFQSTPPRGRRPDASQTRVAEVEFQSTPPRGRRPGGGPASDATPGVSIHASAREATVEVFGQLVNVEVSIHASAREATRRRYLRSPGPRVSIHASAREATELVIRVNLSRPVSIHASAREATAGKEPQCALLVSFNPRLRAGGDRASRCRPRLRGVSIHASAREATCDCCGDGACWYGFNPRLRAGGDTAINERTFRAFGFQSTPPRGRRPGDDGDLPGARVVSIHASAREATDRPQPPDRPLRVSIHASAREATRARPAPHLPAQVSIHASAREATRPGSGPGTSRSRFNPRLRAGGDIIGVVTMLAGLQFQSTPPRGRRLRSPLCPHRYRRFNPRLRAGGDPFGYPRSVCHFRFQSTPPRGRRPPGPMSPARSRGVSIHASAREATTTS